jgi:nicotinamide riboside kinase
MVKKNLKVVSIVGAESSGKTVLAEQLAARIGCELVPEFARVYLENLDRPYEFDDLEIIANGQWENITKGIQNSLPGPESRQFSAAKKSFVEDKEKWSDPEDLITLLKAFNQELIIVDAGMLTIRLWARIKYQLTIPIVEEKMKNDPTSLYLICRPRIEWERDPLREAPGLIDRAWIFNQYLKEIVENGWEYKIIQR